jgi:hypothetical protein
VLQTSSATCRYAELAGLCTGLGAAGGERLADDERELASDVCVTVGGC